MRKTLFAFNFPVLLISSQPFLLGAEHKMAANSTSQRPS
jgi:hypothetical protein